MLCLLVASLSGVTAYTLQQRCSLHMLLMQLVITWRHWSVHYYSVV